MVTATLTAVLFASSVTVPEMDTERLTGGGAKDPPPHPIKMWRIAARRRLLNLAILQYLLGNFARCGRPLL